MRLEVEWDGQEPGEREELEQQWEEIARVLWRERWDGLKWKAKELRMLDTLHAPHNTPPKKKFELMALSGGIVDVIRAEIDDMEASKHSRRPAWRQQLFEAKRHLGQVSRGGAQRHIKELTKLQDQKTAAELAIPASRAAVVRLSVAATQELLVQLQGFRCSLGRPELGEKERATEEREVVRLYEELRELAPVARRAARQGLQTGSEGKQKELKCFLEELTTAMEKLRDDTGVCGEAWEQAFDNDDKDQREDESGHGDRFPDKSPTQSLASMRSPTPSKHHAGPSPSPLKFYSPSPLSAAASPDLLSIAASHERYSSGPDPRQEQQKLDCAISELIRKRQETSEMLSAADTHTQAKKELEETFKMQDTSVGDLCLQALPLQRAELEHLETVCAGTGRVVEAQAYLSHLAWEALQCKLRQLEDAQQALYHGRVAEPADQGSNGGRAQLQAVLVVLLRDCGSLALLCAAHKARDLQRDVGTTEIMGSQALRSQIYHLTVDGAKYKVRPQSQSVCVRA
jgi:hypothetical protein